MNTMSEEVGECLGDDLSARKACDVGEATGPRGETYPPRDVVFTTGTTLSECAKILRKTGTRTVDTGLVPDHIATEPAAQPLTTIGI
ncbi:MAG TPA: hypothetical protein VK901_16175 [Nitrospiraceae bacterium]|nr:hypothetical protein [Nitrospiraceae bacterium]